MEMNLSIVINGPLKMHMRGTCHMLLGLHSEGFPGLAKAASLWVTKALEVPIGA